MKDGKIVLDPQTGLVIGFFYELNSITFPTYMLGSVRPLYLSENATMAEAVIRKAARG